MMTRDTLHRMKAALKKRGQGDMALDDYQALHALINSNLEALDELEGGASAVEKRRELAERERQLRLALADGLRVVKAHPPLTLDEQKVAFILDCAIEMLEAKGPAWKRAWAWYAPRVDEEFGP